MKIMTAVHPTNTAYAAGPNQVVVGKDVARRGMTALYVDYTKGDETSIQIQVEYSNTDDVTGSESWYKQAVEDNAGNLTIAPDYSLSATGKYRIDVPGDAEEDEIRVSLKRTGGATGTGTVTVSVF